MFSSHYIYILCVDENKYASVDLSSVDQKNCKEVHLYWNSLYCKEVHL